MQIYMGNIRLKDKNKDKDKDRFKDKKKAFL